MFVPDSFLLLYIYCVPLLGVGVLICDHKRGVCILCIPFRFVITFAKLEKKHLFL